MPYNWKPIELGWAVLTAAVFFGLEVAVQFDPSIITDWKEWAVNLGGSFTRAVAAGALAYLIARRASN